MNDKVNVILDGLNEEQEKAVQCVDGPVLIIAGAGSGKTRVLTSRIAYILATKNCDPASILALTFTKKAAAEMKERISLMVGEGRARRLVMGTFHAVFVRFLREYAAFLGYPERFTIYDTSDSTSAVKQCIKELKLDEKTEDQKAYKPRDILARISMAKNNLMTVEAYKANPALRMSDTHAKRPRVADIYELYQKKMKQAGVMDFDDILLNMNILLRDNREALDSISSRFRYIMVDEYQDTNFAQYLIIKKLAIPHRNICVVGDDSQSIYAFRGAKIENILNFKKDYPESRLYRLEKNYRSTRNIVDAANSVIAKNEGRIPKTCVSVGETGEKLHVIKSYSETEEASAIVSEISSKMRTDSAQYQDFAILYRTNSQSRALEEALRRRNIPYMVYSGNSFFDRAEVKDMMAYFKLSVNPMDDESFRRVVNKPARAIGGTTLDALITAANANGTSLFKAVYLDNLEYFGLRPAAIEKLRAFCLMINSFAVKVANTDAYELATEIADRSGLYKFYKEDTSVEGMARTANVEELINSVQGFVEERQNEAEGEMEEAVTLDDFLENTALLSNVDVSDDEDTNNKVALMTVHSSKGLEFPYVFIAGLEENLFPSCSDLSSKSDVEEERRLFYVAVTRAKKFVTLSYAVSRMRNGKHESNSPSRFIKEIDSRYLDREPDDEGVEDSGVRVEWGGFGSSYGRSSRVSYEKKSPDRQSRPSFQQQRPSFQPRTAPAQAPSKPIAPPKPEIIDPNFIPVDMRQLYAGERIEHNRFGGGLIKSISGEYPEMKAVIVFDDFGEKLLLLKYAKIRPEKK